MIGAMKNPACVIDLPDLVQIAIPHEQHACRERKSCDDREQQEHVDDIERDGGRATERAR